MDKISAPDVETKPAANAPPAATAAAGMGVQTITRYLKTQSNPDPLYAESVIQRYPSERDAIIALLQQSCGNGFVQRLVAVEKQPITYTQDQTPLPASIPDGTVVDGGMLGPVTSASATAKAEVTLPTIETVVTMVNRQPAMTFTAVVPFGDIHAGDVKPEDIAQITNVTKIGGIGGAISYQLVAGGIQLTLSGAPSVKALSTTGFKLWLASGQTVMLAIHAKTFHTDIGAMDRMETQDEILNMQQAIGSTNDEIVKYPTEKADLEKQLGGQTAQLAKDQATLAKEQGPDFVTLDENGAQLATAH